MAKRILIVDDDVCIVEFMALQLSEKGYEILTAYNGKEGFFKTRQYKPDLVIQDIIMPGMHGSEMAKKMRLDEATRGIPIIFMTSLLEKVIGKETDNSLGGNPILAKPVLMKELLPVIKKLLDEKNAT